MYGFSWIRPNQMAGMAAPGSTGELSRDLLFLRDSGIKLVVSLTEEGLDPQLLARYDLSGLHLPILDFQPPTAEQLKKFVDHARFTISQGGAVGVHCRAGKGRTGTVLAAWLVAEGLAAPEAIAAIREMRPGSIETIEQEEALEEFERLYKKER